MKKIGEGQFSEVFLTNYNNNQVVKKVYKSEARDEARREFLFLSTLKGKGVVEPLFWIDDENPAIVLEYIPEKLEQKYSEQNAQKIISEIAFNLISVFNSGIVINDIKPENIGVKNSKPVLLDFGLATIKNLSDKRFRGSLAFSSPEKIKYNHHHEKSDIFALGMTWLSLLNGKNLAQDYSAEDYRKLILNKEKWTLEISKIENSLIQKMLSWDSIERPSIEEIYYEISENKSIENLKYDDYLFDSQIDFAKNLLSDQKITTSTLDEPILIAETFCLLLESKNIEGKILNENDYILDPVSFFRSQNSKNEKDLNTKNNEIKFCIIRNKFGQRTEFFDKLTENNFCIEVDHQLSGKNLSEKEIEKFSNYFPAIQKIVKNSEHFSAKSLKSLLIKRSDSMLSSAFIYFLSKIPSGTPIQLMDKLFSNWIDSIGNEINNGDIRIQNDKLYWNGNIEFIEKPIDLKSIIEKLHNTEYSFIRAIFYLEYNDKKNAVQHFDKHLLRLIKGEKYLSALEQLKWILLTFPELENSILLRKRLAFLLRKNNKPDQALDLYSKLISETSNAIKGILYSDRAVVLSESGDNHAAMNDLRKASEILKKDGHTRDFLRVTNNLAYTAFQLKEYHLALRDFKNVNQRATSENIIQWQIISELNIASVHLTIGSWKKAELFANSTIDLASTNNKEEFRIQALIIKIQTQIIQGKLENSLSKLEDVLSLKSIQENPHLAQTILPSLLKIYFLTGQSSEQLFEKLVSMDNENNHETELIEMRFWIAVHRNNFMKAVSIAENLENNIYLKLLSAETDETIKVLQQMIMDDEIYESGFLIIMILKYFEINFKEEKQFVELADLADVSMFITDKSGSNADLKFAWNMINDIHKGSTFNEVVESTLQSLLKIGKMERAYYHEFKDGEFQAAINLNGDLNESLNRISRTILNQISEKSEISYFQDLLADEFQDVEGSIFGLGLRCAVGFPLKIKGKTIGVFYSDTQNENKFSNDDRLYLDVISTQVRSNLEKIHLEDQISKVQKSVKPSESYQGMIASSPAMKKIFEKIRIVGKHNINVLITGETGTGKELIARAIHKEYSENEPFVAVNCAAIPEHLIESELFGYKKGAFTGADSDKVGLFEAAKNGVVFLDEIGEMPLSLQPKVLRVLQEREVVPLGSSIPQKINMRVIAATHQNLQQLVNENKFRQDLLYRLSVMPIELPPLRERNEDLPLLIMHFIKKFNTKFEKNIKSPAPEYLQYLVSQKWNGNIRELENEIEKAVLLCEGETLESELQKINGSSQNLDEAIIPLTWKEYKSFKKEYIKAIDLKYAEKLLKTVNGNITKAAQLAGFDRAQIYRLKPSMSKKPQEKHKSQN